MPLETDRLLATVSPCGGLLDYSRLDGAGPPSPVLRRAVPAPAEPGWLAVEVALDDPPGTWPRLLDRTPVSARLALGRGGAPGGAAIVVRYELTDNGLVIAVSGGPGAPARGRLRVRLDAATPSSAVECGAGRGVPGPADDAGLGWDLGEPVALLIRPGPFADAR